MAHFFERRDRWGNSPSLWIVALLVFLIPIGWWALKQTRLENDVEHWMPADNPQLQVLEEARRLFPADERILVSWDGSSLNDPRVDTFRRKLEGITDIHGIQRDGLKEVASVVDPKDLLLEMQRQEVEPQEAARRLNGVLLGAGPLRVKLTEAGRQRFRKTRTDLGKAVRKRFNIRLDVVGPTDNLGELAAIPQPIAEGDETAAAAPAAVLSPEGKPTTRDSLDHDLQLAWNGIAPGTNLTLEIVEFLREFRWRGEQAAAGDVPLIEDCFFVLGSPLALAVNLSEAGAADKPQTIRALRETAAAVGIPPETLRLGGAAVSEVAFHQLAANAAWNPNEPWTTPYRRSVLLLAALTGAAMSYLMLRSLRLTALLLGGALYTSLLTSGLAPVMGHGMNFLLAVMPTMLLVWSIAGAIRLIHEWKRASAMNPATAVVAACRTVTMPCLIAGITLSLACLMLCASGLEPVRTIGFYLAVGAALSMLMTVYGLPALLQCWPVSLSERMALDPRGWKTLGQLLTLRSTLQAVALLAVFAVFAIGLKNVRTESKVIRYFPSTAGIVQDYQFLENQLAGIVPVDLLIRFDATAQDQANFLQRLELVRSMEEKLRAHPDVTGCLSLADFQPVTERPARDAGLLTMTRFQKRASGLEQQVQDGEIAGSTSWYRHIPSDTQGGIAAQPLIAPPGEELWRITAQVMILSDADYCTILADLERISREVLRYQPGSQHVLTGSVPLFLQTQQEMLTSLIRGSLFGLAVIAAMFVVSLRNLAAVVLAMLPTVLPVAGTIGLLGWCGLPVDFGVVLASLIAVGLSLFGTVHFLTAFRRGQAEGKPRPAAVLQALETCGPAMWQTCAIVIVGMAMLAPAELSLISRFGWAAAVMTGLALASEVLLLPLLLLSPWGACFVPPPSRNVRPPSEHPGSSTVPPPHLASANLRIPTR